MNENSFIFEWKLNENGEDKIVEEIPKYYDDYLLENGTIVEEILLAGMVKCLEQKKKIFAFDTKILLNSFSKDFFSELVAEITRLLNNEKLSEVNFTTINFDILENIMFSYVFETCRKNPQGVRRTSKNDEVIRLICEIFILATNDNSNHFKERWYKGNEKEFGLLKFRDLINAIEKSGLKKSYINFKEERKCIALYKKWFGNELTVAFSGHHECVSNDLYDFFNVKQNNRRYLDYEKIAKSIGANLAGTTNFVSRYNFLGGNNENIIRYDQIKDVMCLAKIDKDNWSCCERKIFAFLDNRDKSVYGGKLFVKYPPCNECSLSILYHVVNNEKIFKMQVGLPI